MREDLWGGGCARPAPHPDFRPPEQRIADAFRKELGADLNPQALRIFIRTQWHVLSKAAHEIHDA